MSQLSLTNDEVFQQDFGWDGIMDIKFLTEVQSVIEELKNQEYQLIRIQHILSNARTNNRQVFLCGNGGSSSTASHFACDLFKIAGIRAINLGENMSLTTAIINDDGWENLYLNQLKRLFNQGDILIARGSDVGTKQIRELADGELKEIP